MISTHTIRLLSLATVASLALAGCATSPGYGASSGYGNSYGNSPPPASNSTSCYDCGTVTRIEANGGTSNVPNATGAVLGGLVGAAAGRKIADNNTDSEGRKNSATVAGAVAGAVAGNAIQNRTQASGGYNVYVRMNDGRSTVVSQADINGLREGAYVRVYNGRAWPR